MTTVLICDDRRPVREELRRCVAQLPGVHRVATATTAEEALARWGEEQPSLVLVALDRRPGEGVEATRRLMRAHPDAQVVMLAGELDDSGHDSVARAIAAGLRGFLREDALGSQLCATLVASLAAQGVVPGLPPAPELTEREQQVLRGMADGKSNAQIGRELYLSEDTVKTHARRLFRKLGVGDRAQAVALGFRWGYVR